MAPNKNPKKNISKSSKLKTPTLNIASTSSNPSSSIRKSNFDITDPIFKLPLEHGWRRELVYRTTSSKRKGDVYYYTPKNNRLRSICQVKLYLSSNEEKRLTIKNFTFAEQSVGINDPSKEIIRNASCQSTSTVTGNSSRGDAEELQEKQTSVQTSTDDESSETENKNSPETTKIIKRLRSRSPVNKELKTPTLNIASTSSNPSSSIRKSNFDITDPIFKLPLEHGWRRELVYRTTSSKRKGDVYYYTPDNKRLRSICEVQSHLSSNEENRLTIKNFTFAKQSVGINDPSKEIIRNANCQSTSTVTGNSSRGDAEELQEKQTSAQTSIDDESSKTESKKSPETTKIIKRLRSRSPETKKNLEEEKKKKNEAIEEFLNNNVKTCTELKTPTLNIASTPSNPSSSIRKSNFDITDPIFKLPLEHGWRRELVYRTTSSKRKGDVYYYTPKNNRLRSICQVKLYLSSNEEKRLTIKNFTFAEQSVGINDPSKEIIRNANCQSTSTVTGNSSSGDAEEVQAKQTSVQTSIDDESSKTENKKFPETTKTIKRSRSPVNKELKTPTLNIASTSSNPSSSIRKSNFDITDPIFKLPLEHGWRRELVYRTTSSKRKGDVYYYTPKNNRLRSICQVKLYLSSNKEKRLTIKNFTFAEQSVGINDPSKEIIRNASCQSTSTVTGNSSSGDAEEVQAKQTSVQTSIDDESSKTENKTFPETTKTIKRSRSRSPVNKELKTSTLNIASTSSNPSSSNRKSNFDITDPIFKLPLEHGWRRELVYRTTSSKRKGDVYYYTPKNKRLRSICQIKKYLSSNEENRLTIKNFTFAEQSVGINDPSKEIIRNANCQSTSTVTGNSSSGDAEELQEKQTSVQTSIDDESPETENKNSPETTKIIKRLRSRSPVNKDIISENILCIDKRAKEDSAQNETMEKKSVDGNVQPCNNTISENILCIDKRAKEDSAQNETMEKKSVDGNVQPCNNTISENILCIDKRAKEDNAQNETTEEKSVNGNVQPCNNIISENILCIDKRAKEDSAQNETMEEKSVDGNVQPCNISSQVCTTWNEMVKNKVSWETVDLKSIFVHNWNEVIATIQSQESLSLDMRHIKIPTEIEDFDKFWMNFTTAIEDAGDLKLTKMLIQCPVKTVDTIFFSQNLSQLDELNILIIRNPNVSADYKENQNELLIIDLYNMKRLIHLKNLKIKCKSGLKLTRLPIFHKLVNLKSLSITSVKEFPKNVYRSLRTVTTNLEFLEIGDCCCLSKDFGVVLKRLTNLKSLRLRNCCNEFNEFAQDVFCSIRSLHKLKTLELYNIEFSNDVENELERCDNIETLVIIPTFVSNPHTTIRRLFDCLKKLSNTLRYLVLGFTSDWFKDTDSMITDFKQGRGGYNLDLSCAEETKNISVSRIRNTKEQPRDGSVTDTEKENDQSNIIDIFSIQAFENLLTSVMENASIKVGEVGEERTT